MLNLPEVFLNELIKYRLENDEKVTSFNLVEIIKIFMDVFKAQVNQESHVDLYNEFISIESDLEHLFSDIDKLKPYKMVKKDIPSASSELAEVIKQTEQATNTILDSLEQIQMISGSMEDKETAQMIDSLCLGMMESCNFQDLSGQRIKKVITIFANIEKFINSSLKHLNIPKNEDDLREENLFTEFEKKKGRHLLNGPQTQAEAPDQKAIDDIFNSN